MDRGCYIAFEGAEGCGKTTQARGWPRALDAVLTRETGGTPIGQLIRGDPATTRPTASSTDRAEALLIAADRAQHIAEVVAPGARRRPARGQRPQRLLVARLPGLRPRARRSTRCGGVNDWAIDGLLARPGRAARRRRRACWPHRMRRPRARPLRAGGRRVPRPGRATASARWPPPTRSAGSCVDGRRRRSTTSPPPCVGRGSGERTRRAVTPRPSGTRVVGQPTAVRHAARPRRPIPCTPTCSSGRPGTTKHEAARAFAALLLTGDGRRRPAATPGWRWPASTPTCARSSGSAPAIAKEQVERDHPRRRARPGRGRRKVLDPPRVPPARRRGRGRAC